MAGMTTAQARVIDPILTTHIQGYIHPTRIAPKIFPRVPVAVSGGRVIEFDKESFRLVSTKRAPGTNFKRVQFGHLGKPFALTNRGLEGVVPFEQMRDAAEVPGIDLAQRTAQGVMDTITLDEEYEAAQLARNAANYANSHKVALAGSSKWNHSDSNPAQQIRGAGEVIRSTTGMRPNLLTLSPAALAALKENPAIIERIKYTGRDTVTLDILADLFDVNEVVVGDAVFLNDADAFEDVWGNDALLSYVAPVGTRAQQTPSFGYIYTMENHPAVAEPYAERSTNSWVYQVLLESSPVLTGAAAGYLFQAVT